MTVKNCGNNSYIYGIPYSKHSAYNELVDCLLCLKPGKIHSTVDVQNGDAQVNMLVKSCRELINEELAEGISEIESRSRRGDDYDYEIIGGGGGDSFGREDDVGEENIGDEEDDSSNEFEYDPGIDDLL